MSFAPVRLGNTVLEAETAAADRKSCRRFGPCGVGEKALYLNDLLIDRHFYVGFGSVRRVFKRVAMSQGGFSGKGAFGSIPTSSCSTTTGRRSNAPSSVRRTWTSCLPIWGRSIPEIPRLSVGGEQRLAKRRSRRHPATSRSSHRRRRARARSWSARVNFSPAIRADRSACRSRQGQAHQRAHKSRLPLGRAGDRPRGRGGIGVRHHLVARRQRFRRLLRALRLCRRVSSSRERTFCPRQRITAGRSSVPGTRRRPPWRMFCPRTFPSPPATRIRSCSTA